jgi:ABC-type transporter MlaC component
MSLRKLIPFVIVLVTLAFAGSAFAEESHAFAKRKQDEITAMLNRGSAQGEVNKALGAIFDYPTLIQRCWGEHWTDLNDGQKAEVQKLMTTIIENNYQTNLKKALKYGTEVKSAKPEGEFMKVHIRASDSTNVHAPPVNIEYILRQEGDSWKIVDIVIEGSRMAHNYHSQIHKMMINKDQGYTYVVQKLNERVTASKPKNAK